VVDVITLTALVIVALSPLLRRFYIERFWTHGRGTVIRLEGGINTNPGPGGGTWVWSPLRRRRSTIQLQVFVLAKLQRQIKIRRGR